MYRLGIIGNPENRRIGQFLAAAAARGVNDIPLVSWNELLGDLKRLTSLPECAIWRIDSPGENAEVEARLIRLGGGPAEPTLQFGEIGYLQQVYRGLSIALGRIAATGFAFMSDPDSIAMMFDKWRCHERFIAAGLARPESWLAPKSVAELRDALSIQISGRIFLKPLHGSSASGVCAYRWSNGREQLIAPIKLRRGTGATQTMLFNWLRVQSYQRRSDIDAILEQLLPHGMIVESWLPKARLDGADFDLRIVVIASEPRHVVVRQSVHPMTNLHLGNRRGDIDALKHEFGVAALADCCDLARQACACFPGALYAGVDVLMRPDRRPVLLEINAFGDLLPGIYDRGETTYEAILGACGIQS